MPTPQQTGIGEQATAESNAIVARVFADLGFTRKRKCYTAFSNEDLAAIGRHAAENSNANALKKFKSGFPDLGESTVYCTLQKEVPGPLEAERSTRRQLMRY